jgi:hypothetical protein
MCNCNKNTNNKPSLLTKVKNIWKSTEEKKTEEKSPVSKKSGDYVYKIKIK